MDIKIYQINVERDVNRVRYEGLDRLEAYQGTNEINSAIYDKVFEGSVDCASLEDVYYMFNVKHPAGYRGRSLSVSDIVEVREEEPAVVGRLRFYTTPDTFSDITYTDIDKYHQDIAEATELRLRFQVLDVPVSEPDKVSRFYFCDDIGFKAVAFEPDKAGPTKSPEIAVVVCEPGMPAKATTINTDLADMQAVVGGHIERVFPFNDSAVIVCNEDGKCIGLPFNRALRDGNDNIVDMLVGTFFIAGIHDNDFASLSKQQIDRYMETFRLPERCFIDKGVIKVAPYEPDIKPDLDTVIDQCAERATPADSAAPARDSKQIDL